MAGTGTGDAALARKQLFIDNRFIAESQGIKIHTNPPELRGLVLRGEMPWETGWIHRASILQDGDVIKMWYGAHPPSQDGKLGPYYYCYATSHDGVRWERPELGLVEFNPIFKRSGVARLRFFRRHGQED